MTILWRSVLIYAKSVNASSDQDSDWKKGDSIFGEQRSCVKCYTPAAVI